VRLRQRVRALSVELRFSLVDQTKIITAASELGRNVMVHGHGGEARVEVLDVNGRRGICLTFSDKGPGIADIQLALKDGYSTGNGLGLGLSGSKRLVHEFHLHSEPGQGTEVTITHWAAS
jgi:serine/threonine-protein kinase RsbT